MISREQDKESDINVMKDRDREARQSGGGSDPRAAA